MAILEALRIECLLDAKHLTYVITFKSHCPFKVGRVSPILQMGKLRLGEIKECIQHYPRRRS